MGGTIDKKEWKRMEKVRESAELARLKAIEAAARKFINNPTPQNKESLEEELFPEKEKNRKLSSSWIKIKTPFAGW